MELGLGRHPERDFAVRDTGIGISAADFPHVFERFWRAGNAVANVGRGGFGLRLAISQRVAQAHGGTLTASSRLGRGSLLPLHATRDDGQRSCEATATYEYHALSRPIANAREATVTYDYRPGAIGGSASGCGPKSNAPRGITRSEVATLTGR